MILLLAILVIWLFSISGPAAIVFLLAACAFEAVEIIALKGWAGHLNRKQPPQDPDEELTGMTAEVVVACRPKGQVRVRGELWAARCDAGADAGSSVRIEAVDGLILRVAPLALSSEGHA
jgi:membrane protein implicated in regulation of membrane protease activity